MNLWNWFKSLLIGGVGSRDWSNNLPPWTSQYSIPTRVDAMDCLSESLVNIIYMLTGFDGSPRALAKLAGTTSAGNSVDKVVAAVNKYGLIPYELWPTPDSFTWFSYYDDIPQAVLDQAVRCKVELLPPNLNVSPLWTELSWGLPPDNPQAIRHMVAQINPTQYFDSELGDEVKLLSYQNAKVVYQKSLKITLMIDCKTVRFADNKTLGIMINTPNGVQIIKATSEEQWKSWNKPDSYGKPTVNPDGTTNFTAELQLNF